MKSDLGKIKETVKNLRVDVVGLFGSRARGDNRADSDYDIFIMGDLTLEEELELEERLEKNLNQVVDLVRLTEKTDKRLAKNIINDGFSIVSNNDKYEKFSNEVEWFYRENSDFIEMRKRDLID